MSKSQTEHRKPETENRKREHVDIAISKEVQYIKKSGFEKVELQHNALPEIDYEEVDLSTEFLGKKIKYPLLISAMTGGYPEAKKINEDLASAAQKHNIAFAVGSQRAMLENPSLKETYSVRDVAPDIPLIGNVGAVQLKRYKFEDILNLVPAIEADALAVHLNPLQEVVQPEGDRDFSGILEKITQLCKQADFPIIVKEVGTGVSQEVALKLKQAGVSFIDVAGSGGTSWSKVEYARDGPTSGFEEWGIPTLESLIQCRETCPLIASGGIRNGIDIIKALALGAKIGGAAYPFLKALNKTQDQLDRELNIWEAQMKKAAFLTGSKNVEQLRSAKLVFV
jgi:isopentenyl-diphosphate delta-isomerase